MIERSERSAEPIPYQIIANKECVDPGRRPADERIAMVFPKTSSAPSDAPT